MTSFAKSLTTSLLIGAFALPGFAETATAALDPADAAVAQAGPTQGGVEINAAQALVGQQVTSADGQIVGVVETAEAMDDGSLRVTVAVAGSDNSFAFNVLATTAAKDALRLEMSQAELLRSLAAKPKV
jgi:hypothetical protein